MKAKATPSAAQRATARAPGKAHPPEPAGADADATLSSTPSAAKKALLIEALSYIGRFKGKIVVVKYGGAAQEHAAVKVSFAQDIVLLQSLGMLPVIVHGGGPEVSRTMKAMGQEAVFVDGLRVTTAEGLGITEMVLSGHVNKEIVAQLNAAGGRAVGISGKDGPTLLARKLQHAKGVDLGYVGDIETVRPELLQLLLSQGFIPVVSPIGIGTDGTTFNINADSAASRIAAALKAEKMIFMTDVDGVLRDGKLISALTRAEALELMDRGVISGGMVPKIEAMLHCLSGGVGSATIINGGEHHAIIAELFTDKGVGTQIRA
jgi:acetylglutamate kinase